MVENEITCEVETAAKCGRSAVARVLARHGEDFNIRAAKDLEGSLDRYQTGHVFLRCIAEAACWAGFVARDAAEWYTSSVRYLETQSPHLAREFPRGFRGKADVKAYMDTWCAVRLGIPGDLPNHKSSGIEIATTFDNCMAILKELDWRRERSWLGPWTFHGAFKIFLLSRKQIWSDKGIDAVTLPTGGTRDGGFSFEGGWSFLHARKLVPAFPEGGTFDEKMTAARQAHTECIQLAGLASTCALHINSGIFKLGSKRNGDR
jgi:hypothetical protein